MCQTLLSIFSERPFSSLSSKIIGHFWKRFISLSGLMPFTMNSARMGKLPAKMHNADPEPASLTFFQSAKSFERRVDKELTL